jgi:hypothetical protein
MQHNNLLYLFPEKGTSKYPFSNTASAVFSGTPVTDTSILTGTSSMFNYEYTQPFSVGCWFKQTGLPDGGLLVGKAVGESPAVPGFTGWLLVVNGDGVNNLQSLAFGLALGGVGKAQVTTDPFKSYHAGDWIFAVATSDGSGRQAGLHIYLNGQLQASGSLGGDTLDGNSILNPADFSIGALTDNNTSEENFPYLGNINQVTMWNTALTQAQVTALYNNGTANDPRLSTANANLVSWYPLVSSRDTTSTVYDVIGGNNLTNTLVTLTGSLPPNPFVEAFSGSFDGATAYVDMGNNFDQVGSTAQSFSFWLNPASLPSGGQILFSKLDTSAVAGYMCFARGTTGAQVEFQLRSNLGSTEIDVYTTANVLTVGTWTHVLITYSGSGTAAGVAVYINGTSTALTIAQDNFTGSASNTGDFLIGTRYAGSYALFYDGLMDEFAIANGTALTSGNAVTLYNGGIPPNLGYNPGTTLVSGLTNWYRFESGLALYPDTSSLILDRLGFVTGTNNNVTFSSTIP